mgnify:CR=1 FL=1
MTHSGDARRSSVPIVATTVSSGVPTISKAHDDVSPVYVHSAITRALLLALSKWCLAADGLTLSQYSLASGVAATIIAIATGSVGVDRFVAFATVMAILMGILTYRDR